MYTRCGSKWRCRSWGRVSRSIDRRKKWFPMTRLLHYRERHHSYVWIMRNLLPRLPDQSYPACGSTGRRVRELSTVSCKKRSRVRCNHSRRLKVVLEYWTLSMISSFDICAIRRIVHNMYISWENVNLEILLARVQENLSFFTSKGSQRTLLLQNGVRFRKINVRKILMGGAQSKGIVLCTYR